MKPNLLIKRPGLRCGLAAGLCFALLAPSATGDDPGGGEVEYFFNSDPGEGNGTVLDVAGDSAAFTANTANLKPGTHTLYLRTRPSGGIWGPPLPMTVTIDPSSQAESLAAWEMSIGTLAPAGTGTPMPMSTGPEPLAQATVIPLTGMPPGLQTVYFRAKDSAGTWGAAFPWVFTIEESGITDSLVSLQYAWGTDPATRVWTTVPMPQPGERSQTLSIAPDLAAMALGSQTLTLRTLDSSGNSGPPMSLPVAVVPDSLTGHVSPAVKLVAYAADANGVIPGTFLEQALGPHPAAHHSFTLPLADSAPGPAEVIAYLVNQAGESSPLASANFAVVVEGTNGYLAWKNTPGYFSEEELLDESVSGVAADPDHDGITNQVECAMRTHPRTVSNGDLPTVSRDGGKLRLSFRQVQGGTGHRAFNYTVDGLRYSVEWSAAPGGAWQSGGSELFEVTQVSDNGDGTDTVVVEASTTLTANQPQGFLRLKLTLL